jgi:hypothetical protein
VSVAAQNGLAKVVADRVTHNLSLSSTDNLLLSNDCWQAIVASIRRLDILAFFTARKERLDIYACSQPDGNLYVYCADKASLGAVACPAPEGTGEFTTVLTADALAVIGLLFDIDMEEDGADAADMVANVSLALTNTGFLVYNEAALLYMPSPQTGESILVQLTLQGVLDKCEGTNFEEPIRKCIMKCVYTGCKLEKEINKVMNQYYEV